MMPTAAPVWALYMSPFPSDRSPGKVHCMPVVGWETDLDGHYHPLVIVGGQSCEPARGFFGSTSWVLHAGPLHQSNLADAFTDLLMDAGEREVRAALRRGARYTHPDGREVAPGYAWMLMDELDWEAPDAETESMLRNAWHCWRDFRQMELSEDATPDPLWADIRATPCTAEVQRLLDAA